MLDYLSDDALVFIEDAEELALVVDELETQARTLKRDLTDVGDLPSEWPDPYFGWGQLSTALSARNPIVLGFTAIRPPTADRRPPTNNQQSLANDHSSRDTDNSHPREFDNSQFRSKGPLWAIDN